MRAWCSHARPALAVYSFRVRRFRVTNWFRYLGVVWASVCVFGTGRAIIMSISFCVSVWLCGGFGGQVDRFPTACL